MKLFGAFIITLLTGGGVDYMPGAHRPWVVDFGSPLRSPGRGGTLWQAWGDHFR